MSRISWDGPQCEGIFGSDHSDVNPRSSASQKTPRLDTLMMSPPQPIPVEVMVRLAGVDVAALTACMKSYYSAYHAYARVMAGSPTGSAVSYNSFTSGGLTRDSTGAVVSPWTLASEAQGRQRVGGDGVSNDDGFCYLQCFHGENRSVVRSDLGAWPTLDQILSRSVDEFQLPAIERLAALRVHGGGWHFYPSQSVGNALDVLRHAALGLSCEYPFSSLGAVLVGESSACHGGRLKSKWLSSRPKDAVVAAADAYGGRVRTVSDVCGTMEKVRDVLPSDVEPGSLLLGTTSFAVAKLKVRYRDVPRVQILTVSQAQGLSCDNVYLFRFGDEGEEQRLGDPVQMSIAFTRHLKKFRYVSSFGRDYVTGRLLFARRRSALDAVVDVCSAGLANKLMFAGDDLVI